MIEAQWQLIPEAEIPAWLLAAVAKLLPETTGKYAAQLLWQRGIRTPEELPGFLNPDNYQPTSAFAFGQEMKWAVKRIIKARENQEKVTIWGDFDADGVTSTSVLWEGLGQFLTAPQQLDYYVPNRLTESHGLNQAGIAKLASQGTQLIITCDTGSNNLLEIAYAKELGIDIIITDHHTLPAERPDVVAIINPRYFAQFHPLYHLAGVAVAYKLVEAMYASLPHVPTQPLEELLDLVAIGLIADLVELKGDCRYLAQIGIRQLKKQTNSKTASRPGVAHLLRLCRKTGDRPTDIGFGIGPRINAVSRIQGDASFCIELLTSRDEVRCRQLAEMAELANTRRKSLQNETLKQVEAKLSRLDLSTTQVIVLDDPQWQAGVLGLVASRIAQIYGRPTILLNTESQVNKEKNAVSLARGSARSVNSIDLYELVNSQANLLDKFGGHPYAAGLSLPLENLSLFRDGINQQFWQKYRESKNISSNITADLIITVNDLGASLFKELNLLEPYGMGNPVPKLLIKNCWFT
ncbi:MAG: single-stranded-DNA-specific exonuclease RecJ, partial [Cyanobacteria bacterium J083]